MSTHTVAPQFEDRGIKPIVYGLPELPKAPQTNALARRIKRTGIQDHDGTQIASFDDASAEMLAYPWVYPQQISGQLAAPQVISVQAGTLYFVTGLALATRLMPPYHNSRARSKLPIPATDDTGRVNFPWPTRDVSSDPTDNHRLLVRAAHQAALTTAAQNTAQYVEAMQSKLKDMLSREGVEEQILIVPGRFVLDDGQLPNDTAWLGADGGSRITIQQGHLADVIDSMLVEGVKLPPKRKAGLQQLAINLRNRTAGLFVRDALAERDLRDELLRLGTVDADELIKTGLYAGPRAMIIPARALVAFRPHGNGKVLDAVQQLIGNAHKRGPKQWDSSATAVDTRDEVLRKLHEAGRLKTADLLLYGPAFHEGYANHEVPPEPDFRAGELVRLFHGDDALGYEAKKATREVLRPGRLTPQMRAQVIAGAILEQIEEPDPKRRDNIEATLNEILAHEPFYGTDVDWPSRNPSVNDLVDEATAEEDKHPGEWGPAKVELAVKGGIAMASIGALQRPFGEWDKEQRSYNVLLRVAHSKLGLELLGAAVEALRDGSGYIPALDPKTRTKKAPDGNGNVQRMEGVNLRELFPGTSGSGNTTQATAEAYLKSIVRHLKNSVSGAVEGIQELPDVQQNGINPANADLRVALDLLDEYATELRLLARQHARRFAASSDEGPGVADDEAEEEM